METLLRLFEAYGYWVAFGIGFAEFAGVPIAGVPLLIAGGALARTAGLDAVTVAGCAAVGGLVGDAIWFVLARWQGDRLVDAACGLSARPEACVLGVKERAERLGAPYVLSAKFLPGAGNLIASAAGLARYRPGPFLALDAVALGAWAGAYVGLGWLFAADIAELLQATETYGRWVLAAAAALVLAGVVRRAYKTRVHGPHPVPGDRTVDQ